MKLSEFNPLDPICPFCSEPFEGDSHTRKCNNHNEWNITSSYLLYSKKYVLELDHISSEKSIQFGLRDMAIFVRKQYYWTEISRHKDFIFCIARIKRMLELQMKKFRRKELEYAPIEDLIRLCKWLEIDESSDFKRESLINWLIWMDYCENPNLGGWR